MSEIIAAELDLTKNVFRVHGADGTGQAVLRKKLRRVSRSRRVVQPDDSVDKVS